MGKINDTSAYAVSTPVTGDDYVIGSDGGSGGPTKNFLMSDIATYVMSPSVSTITLDQVCLVGSSTTTGMTIADTLSLTKAVGTGLAVTADATIGGTLGVTGATTLTGALDANSTADIADTLTLSKATGTGLDVVADASIGGTLTMGIGDGVVTNQITAPSLANIAFYMGGVQIGAFVAPLGTLALASGLNVTSGSTTLQDTLFQGGLYTTPDTPASASASGMAGQISVDADYIYVCTATNTWKRVSIAW